MLNLNIFFVHISICIYIIFINAYTVTATFFVVIVITIFSTALFLLKNEEAFSGARDLFRRQMNFTYLRKIVKFAKMSFKFVLRNPKMCGFGVFVFRRRAQQALPFAQRAWKFQEKQNKLRRMRKGIFQFSLCFPRLWGYTVRRVCK